MPLCAYQHKKTLKIEYFFAGEEPWIQHYIGEYILLPPNPVTVPSTVSYMTEDPYLDSMPSLHDLDQVLTMEAAQDREDKQYQECIRNI
jgi:hypothetical protein